LIDVILHDREIRRLCEHERMIVPFTLDQLNPASYDLILGNEIMIESATYDELVRLDITDNTQDDPYWLKPGQWILAETFETFNMPPDVAGLFFLKSSRAREGLEHMHAGFADPDWHGSKLTLELTNARKLRARPIWPGMKIGQMVFFLTAGTPDISYAACGHYNDHGTVMPSWEAA
jgi:dCTP deaminase